MQPTARARSCRLRAVRRSRGWARRGRSSASRRPGTRRSAPSPSRGRSGPRRGSDGRVRGRDRPRCARSRKRDDPVEIGADDAVLGRGRRQLLEPRELTGGGLQHMLRQVLLLDLAAQLVDLGLLSSPSPSSSWIAFNCCRRKNSRRPLSISLATCDWILEPSSDISTSRLRIRETARSRSSTSTSLEQLLPLVGLQPEVDAIRWQSALGSSTFAAASWSSSGRYGVMPMIWPNRCWTFRVSASTSGDSGTMSGSSSSRRGGTAPPAEARRCGRGAAPGQGSRRVPSGTLIILWTTASVRLEYRSSQPGGRPRRRAR